MGELMKKYHVAALIEETYTTDSIGQKIAAETARTVFCEMKSVTRAEWVAGGQMGLNPDMTIEVFGADYGEEKICEIDGVRYGIYRTFARDTDHVELYLTKKAGVTNGV